MKKKSDTKSPIQVATRHDKGVDFEVAKSIGLRYFRLRPDGKYEPVRQETGC